MKEQEKKEQELEVGVAMFRWLQRRRRRLGT